MSEDIDRPSTAMLVQLKMTLDHHDKHIGGGAMKYPTVAFKMAVTSPLQGLYPPLSINFTLYLIFVCLVHRKHGSNGFDES